MSQIKLSKGDLALLNSKLGLHLLFKNRKLNIEKALEELHYYQLLKKQQEELILLQKWVIEKGKKMVILFEGRDAAGKGGAIRRITEYINPRHFRIVALGIPSEDERNQWFLQRYIQHLPKPGEIVFFDRSWYNRAIVEPVNGFCTKKEYKVFMSQVNDFERMLVQSDTYFLKLYFSMSKEEQAYRFKEIKASPLKKWKITPVDERAQELWDDYTSYEEKMFDVSHTEHSPWHIIEADHKSNARLEAIEKVLESVPYKE